MSASKRDSSTASPSCRCMTAGSTPTRARSTGLQWCGNCSTRPGEPLDSPSCLCFYANMRTTVDLPDELFRRAKSEAALRGKKLRDLIEEGLRAVIDDLRTESPSPPPKRVSAHDLMKDLIFEDTGDGPTDLST